MNVTMVLSIVSGVCLFIALIFCWLWLCSNSRVNELYHVHLSVNAEIQRLTMFKPQLTWDMRFGGPDDEYSDIRHDVYSPAHAFSDQKGETLTEHNAAYYGFLAGVKWRDENKSATVGNLDAVVKMRLKKCEVSN